MTSRREIAVTHTATTVRHAMTDDADPNAPITPPVRRQTARPGVFKRVPGDGRLTGPPVRPDAPVPATVGESEPPPVPLAEQRSESERG